ncbi:hypothetical protein [Streptomyces sp. B8F3]|uniref:hypothetical protein n=1 Tax=unclassified Streptomyces TaxID=2593676 RepID=UPI00325C6DB0
MIEWSGFRPCTCIAVDAQSYGSNNDRSQSEIQHDLPRLLGRAAAGAGLDRANWQIQRKGDEQLAVRPVDGSEPRLVDDYIRHLVSALREYNGRRVPEERMRLRAAIHQGPVELADNGFAGTAVVATARLLNSAPLYDALAAHSDADLVLLVSDDVFRATVAGGHTTLSPTDFTRHSVRVKEYEATAWLYVPGTAEPGGPAADRSQPAAAGNPRPGTGTGGEYRADKINVSNFAGPVDARNSVFGFGSTGG